MKGAIFDLDGTLLDTGQLWTGIDRAFLGRRGIALSGDYLEAVNSMSFRKAAEYTIERYSLPDTPEALMAEWEDLSRKAYAEDVRLYPGAGEYLRMLSGKGTALAVATDLDRDIAVSALSSNGILSLFSAVVTTKEAGRDKRYPDVFLMAASALGLSPEECVVYEDLPSAAVTASDAGFGTVIASAFQDECRRLFP